MRSINSYCITFFSPFMVLTFKMYYPSFYLYLYLSLYLHILIRSSDTRLRILIQEKHVRELFCFMIFLIFYWQGAFHQPKYCDLNFLFSFFVSFVWIWSDSFFFSIPSHFGSRVFSPGVPTSISLGRPFCFNECSVIAERKKIGMPCFSFISERSSVSPSYLLLSHFCYILKGIIFTFMILSKTHFEASIPIIFYLFFSS